MFTRTLEPSTRPCVQMLLRDGAWPAQEGKEGKNGGRGDATRDARSIAKEG